MTKFNIEKQIQYWKETSLSDMETAEILIDKGKILHGLFFCHLSIEKLLKAHFVKANKEIAPKTHDLIYLIKKANLELDDSQKTTLLILMHYQLEGRYPDYYISNPGKEKADEYIDQTKKLIEWLTQKL